MTNNNLIQLKHKNQTIMVSHESINAFKNYLRTIPCYSENNIACHIDFLYAGNSIAIYEFIAWYIQTIYHNEIFILNTILSKLKIDDISITMDFNGLQAKDDDNIWINADFYQFLLHETFIYDDNGNAELLSTELFQAFKILAQHYHVSFPNNVTPPISL